MSYKREVTLKKMNVLDPSGNSTTLSSGNGILQGSECGIYNAQYTTSQEGNYTVGISATNPSGTATFNTSFLAERSYPFDIIRTADSKIDPVDNPNLFNVRLDFSSHTNATSISIQESVPSTFNVTTDASVQTVGDSKILTWNKDLVGNKTSVQYDYSVPSVYPQLYALGPAQIIYGNNQTFMEARPWFVAVDPATHSSFGSTSGTTTSLARAITFPTGVTWDAHTVVVVGISDIVSSGKSVPGIAASNDVWLQSGTTCTAPGANPTFTNATSAAAYKFTSTTANIREELWYLQGPVTLPGTPNVCVRFSAAPTEGYVTYVRVTGVNDTNGIGVQNSATGTTSPARVSSWTVTPGDLMVDYAPVHEGSSTVTTETPAPGHRLIAAGATVGSSTHRLETAMGNMTIVSSPISPSWTLASGTIEEWGYGAITLHPVNRNLPESLSLTDTIKKSVTKSLTESISLSDSVTNLHGRAKSLTESTSLTDSVTNLHGRAKSLTESISLIDSITTLHNNTGSLSESLSLTDAVATLHGNTKSLTESVSMSDTPSSARTVIQSLTESVSLTDGITSHTYTAIISDTLSMSDSLITSQNVGPGKELVPNNQTSITVTPDKPTLVITSSNAALSSITIPTTVTNPEIDYSRIVSSQTVHIANPLNITKDINGDGKPEIVVTIPAGTISGASWDGIITLPTLNTTLSLTLPAPAGQVATANTVIEIGSQVPLSFDNAVRILFVGQSGYHIGYFHAASSVTEIVPTCTADDQTTNNALPSGASCKINVGSNLVVWTKHFTGFVTWTLHSTPVQPPAHLIATSGGGYGTGITISGATGAGGLNGITTPDLTLYQVSYDICNQYKTDIVVGSTSPLLPTVILGTPKGIVNANVSSLQPYSSLLNLTHQYITVYEAPLQPQLKSFNLLINEANGIGYIVSTVSMTTCEKTINYTEIPSIENYSSSAPQIFDVSFQVGNQSKILTANATTQYVANQTLSVSGIVYSPTPIDLPEIRFVQAGQNETNYTSLRMNIASTNMSNVYAISGTMPRNQMMEPGITYWVWTRNTDQLTDESDRYSIGVMPPFAINGTVGFEMNQNVVEGSMQSPTIYVQNNANSTMFGTVSLVVNGTVVSSYTNQLFDRGTSVLQLNWIVPTIYNATSYPVQVQAQFYNTTLDSKQGIIDSYPRIVSMPLSHIGVIQNFIGSDGNITASPYIMYSSFYNTGNLTYKVVSSGDTCVIGPGNCLVSDSTFKQGRQFTTLDVDNQTYNIQYSGTRVLIQNFTITSSEPIIGPWKVTIQKAGVEQTSLEETVLLKIKYLREVVPSVTFSP